MPLDSTLIVPRFSALDGSAVVVYWLLAAWLPGHAIRRLSGLRPSERPERWALDAVLGTLWTSLAYYGLAIVGQQSWHLWAAALPVVAFAARALGARAGYLRRGLRRWRSGWSAGLLTGLLLAGVFAGHYLLRVAACVEYDPAGLRLYGALYSDKMTNMSPCAALLHGVPPRQLRFAGHACAYHYFPHVFIAAAARTTGVDYVNGFWFYAAAIGIAIRSLAVLGFCRRLFRSYGVGCLALLFFGLAQFDTETRPLDLSIPLLLLGLGALDRYRAASRRRWLSVAVLLLAALPLYEVYHAVALCGGLAVWWLAGCLRRRELGRRTVVVGAVGLATLLALQLTLLGTKNVAPVKIVRESTFRQSYKAEWVNAIRAAGQRPTLLKTLFIWKRGRLDLSPQEDDPTAGAPPPNLAQRVVGAIVFETGLLGYVLLRFVNLALFGCLALWAMARSPGRAWQSTHGIAASIAVVGFGFPAFFDAGQVAGNQWWGSPNVYRLTTCANLLLLLVGAGLMAHALRQWRRPRWWPLLALAAWRGYVLLAAAFAPIHSYHHVDHDRLAALTFLRARVPYGEVVIHPWIDDLIRDDRAPDQVAWVYKRHFTLGSNLAGQQMYYEGREDFHFSSGDIAPDEVYQRKGLRADFYHAPSPATIAAVLGPGAVQWVVADRGNPAPPAIAEHWAVAYANATVRIYRREPAMDIPTP